MPVLKILPPGTYTRLRQQRVTEGAPEAQVKIPLLSSANSFSKQVSFIEGLVRIDLIAFSSIRSERN